MKYVGILALYLTIYLLGCVQPETEKPTANQALNVVLITADDLGWSDLACYGSDLHETPNLNRLSQEGFKFDNAYAASPVCSPTRASILTGKYPARLGVTIWAEAGKNAVTDKKLIPPDSKSSLDFSEITLAELLKEQGYNTAHVGKWHLGGADSYPELHGFDVNIGCCPWGCPATFFYPYRGEIYGTNRYIEGLELSTANTYFEKREREYLTDRLTSEAIKIIQDAGDRPLFLNLAYYSVHVPIEAKKPHIDYFQNKIGQNHNHRNARYAGMVKSLDENIGHLITALEETGKLNNTLIIFLSDNGGYIGKDGGAVVTNNFPLKSGKGSLYEGGIKIPMIVRFPKQSGKSIKTPVLSTDIYPTIAEFLNVDLATKGIQTDGKSFLPIIKTGIDTLERENMFWHFPHYYTTTTPVSAIRKGDWKLIEYFEDNSFELYKLDNDPGELKNLSTMFPDKTEELKSDLQLWRKEVDAQLPAKNSFVSEN